MPDSVEDTLWDGLKLSESQSCQPPAGRTHVQAESARLHEAHGTAVIRSGCGVCVLFTREGAETRTRPSEFRARELQSCTGTCNEIDTEQVISHVFTTVPEYILAA